MLCTFPKYSHQCETYQVVNYTQNLQRLLLSVFTVPYEEAPGSHPPLIALGLLGNSYVKLCIFSNPFCLEGELLMNYISPYVIPPPVFEVLTRVFV